MGRCIWSVKLCHYSRFRAFRVHTSGKTVINDDDLWWEWAKQSSRLIHNTVSGLAPKNYQSKIHEARSSGRKWTERTESIHIMQAHEILSSLTCIIYKAMNNIFIMKVMRQIENSANIGNLWVAKKRRRRETERESNYRVIMKLKSLNNWTLNLDRHTEHETSENCFCSEGRTHKIKSTVKNRSPSCLYFHFILASGWHDDSPLSVLFGEPFFRSLFSRV